MRTLDDNNAKGARANRKERRNKNYGGGWNTLDAFYLWVIRRLLSLFYRVEHKAFHHIPERGPCLIVANHVSYLDGVFIQAACRRPIRFVIDYHIYHSPFVRHFMKLHRAIPILPKRNNVRQALDEISRALRRGEAVMIFPEGRITYTGALGRFKPGMEWIVDRDPVPVYPVAIRGLWDSMFSRKYLRSRRRMLPRFFRLKVELECGARIEAARADAPSLQSTMIKLLKAGRD
ncbi:MAG: 1-acyl-sn-glycerol-3-phosphate acyltransferase [Rickettsiales bacterium]